MPRLAKRRSSVACVDNELGVLKYHLIVDLLVIGNDNSGIRRRHNLRSQCGGIQLAVQMTLMQDRDMRIVIGNPRQPALKQANDA